MSLSMPLGSTKLTNGVSIVLTVRPRVEDREIRIAEQPEVIEKTMPERSAKTMSVLDQRIRSWRTTNLERLE